MPITGSTKGKSVARLGVMRLGATRLDYYQPWFKVLIGGTDRTNAVRIGSATITQNLNSAPDTASFRVSGFTPSKGQTILVYMGDADVSHCLFGGHILSVTTVYEGDLVTNVAYDLACIDFTWRLSDKKALKQYTSTSATDIVKDLIATYTTGITTVHVAPNLATIDAITFVNTPVPDALDTLSKKIGGAWYLDYAKDLHFFLSENFNAQSVTDAHASGWAVTGKEDDLSQVRTRAIVKAAASTASSDVPVGSTSIPVVDGTIYSATGGYVEVQGQRISYTGIAIGASGTVTAGILQGPSAPSASVAAGSSGDVTGVVSYKVAHVLPGGLSEVSSASGSVTVSAVSGPSAPSASFSGSSGDAAPGVYLYKTTYVTAKGETLASSPSASATVPAVSAPGAPSPAATTTSGDVTIGAHKYKTTYVTAKGETLASGASSTATVAAVVAPSSGPAVSVVAGSSGNLSGAGTYGYGVSYLTSKGETLAVHAGGATISAVSAPGGSGTAAATTGGSMTASSGYYYGVTFVTANGETTRGPATAVSLGVGQTKVNLSSIPTSGDGRVTARKIYRTAANAYALQYLATINDNVTTTYADTAADSTLGVADPTINTSAWGRISLTSLPTSGDARVTGRNIYRTAAGGSTYLLLTTINDDVTTTFSDNVADSNLGVQDPSVQSAGASTITVSSIPVSGDARVIRRRLYRTKAGGSTYFLLTTIGDNSTTSFTDNAPDANLGDPEPAFDGSGGGTISVSSIATSGDGRVVRRRLYRTEAGGSVYKALATIGDDVTTTYDDSKADNSLGDAEPAADASGGGVVTVTVPTGAATVTARTIYRTAAGGSVYKLAGSINDNVTTTFTDTKADASLGADAATGSLVRTEAGAVYLPIESEGALGAFDGWIRVQGQVITGRIALGGAQQIENIPASGFGAIVAPIAAGSAVLVEPTINGIPGSGDGSIQYAITAGAQVAIRVERDDATAQSNLAALLGSGDGVVEDVQSATDIGIPEATTLGDATLTLYKNPIVTVTGTTRDQTVRSGRTITFSLTNPSVSGTYLIQTITLSELAIGGTANYVFPVRTANVSSVRFSLESILQQLQKRTA